jgi:hypothetical protein
MISVIISWILCKCIRNHVVCLTTGPLLLQKGILQSVRSGVSSLNFQYFVFSLTSSKSYLSILPHLLAPSNFPSLFTPITSFRMQRNLWSVQLDFLPFIVCGIFLSSLTLLILHFFLHDQTNWSSPSLSSTTLQKFSVIFDLLSEASKFYHHTKLWSKCSSFFFICKSTLPKKSLLLVDCCFFDRNREFHFMHFIVQNMLLGSPNSRNISHSYLFLMNHDLYWRWLPWDSYFPSFFYIHFRYVSNIYRPEHLVLRLIVRNSVVMAQICRSMLGNLLCMFSLFIFLL